MPREFADEMLEKMRFNKFGEHAEVIGEVVSEHCGIVALKPASVALAFLICNWANSCRAFVSFLIEQFLNRTAQDAPLVG